MTPQRLAEAVPLDEHDTRYLRRAIAWAHMARRRGNSPYGAVLVAASGAVLAEAGCADNEHADATAHAELQVVRTLAGRELAPGTLAGATLYASAEPCVMCAGAIALAGIGRVVYGVGVARLQDLGAQPLGGGLLGARTVFEATAQPLECIGPALLHEAVAAIVAL